MHSRPPVAGRKLERVYQRGQECRTQADDPRRSFRQYCADFPVSAGRYLQNHFLHWTPDGGEVVYSWHASGLSNLWAQPLDGGSPRQLTTFRSGLVWDFAFSRDGKQVALARGDDTTDVVLIRNFR
jgi:hypothetical protein